MVGGIERGDCLSLFYQVYEGEDCVVFLASMHTCVCLCERLTCKRVKNRRQGKRDTLWRFCQVYER